MIISSHFAATEYCIYRVQCVLQVGCNIIPFVRITTENFVKGGMISALWFDCLLSFTRAEALTYDQKKHHMQPISFNLHCTWMQSATMVFTWRATRLFIWRTNHQRFHKDWQRKIFHPNEYHQNCLYDYCSEHMLKLQQEYQRCWIRNLGIHLPTVYSSTSPKRHHLICHLRYRNISLVLITSIRSQQGCVMFV